MQLLYGVAEGPGHALRSRVLIEHLARAGHELRVVVSGRAHPLLTTALAALPNVTVAAIPELASSFFEGALPGVESVFSNKKRALRGVVRRLEAFRQVAEAGFSPELVLSDFESWAGLHATDRSLPVVSIDHLQIADRCRHDDAVTAKGTGLELLRVGVKQKLPKAYHYLITSFFFPPVRKKYTTLLPPLVRPELVGQRWSPREHVLVHQSRTASLTLVPTLKRLPYRFRVYGLGREGTDGNVTFCSSSEQKFVEDLTGARAVIASGGFSLLAEATSLGIPAFSIPVAGQYDQELTARYLDALGVGAWSRRLEAEPVAAFLERSTAPSPVGAAKPVESNARFLACLDEVLSRASRGEPRPVVLESPASARWEG